ncbi:MAG: glycosyltransferase family 4 protein [Spirochaetales bacterium]|nr:glycosyltransferase family 4 protein [Spirochaetales bacterium]
MKFFVTGTRGIPDIQGGIETHCRELYPRLVSYGWKITLAVRSSYTPGPVVRYKGVGLVGLPALKIRGLEAFVHTFIAVMYARFHGFRAVHIHAVGPALLVPLARLLGFRVVFTHHGQDYRRQKWGNISKGVLRLGEMFGSLCAHKIIAVSKGIKHSLLQKYGRKDIEVVPNGVCILDRTKQTGFIRSIGLIPGHYMLGVGRLVPEKGFHDLIEAFGRLPRNMALQCVVAGDADPETAYSRRLKDIARKAGCVLPGYVGGDKLRELYSHARLFVLPSYHEGLPIALLEALSYDCHVLVSDINANKEIDIPGISYFKTGDAAALYENILVSLKNPASCSCRKILSEKYGWNAIAEKTHGVLEGLFK